MVLNRPLRTRKRKLPPPPGQQIPRVEQKIPQQVESPKIPSPTNISPNDLPKIHTPLSDLPKIHTSPSDLPKIHTPLSDLPRTHTSPSGLPPLPSTDQPKEETPYSSILPANPPSWQDYQKSMQEAVAKEKVESTELLNELADVISKGIDSKLEKVDVEHLEKDIDYATILKIQFNKATNDYFEAGKKFQEAGLRSNSAMSYACAVFSSILGSGENYAFHQWKIIKDQLDEALKSSILFSIIEQMFQALDKRSKEGIYGVLNLLKRLETFSVEDQELIANTAAYLAKRAEVF
ncbi:MAG: hypothetical protein HeimC3_25850 [Candidatus Heimdallarchaeota archaeon LC_3]|nr:MAG: hypothetical protein HeimC3_25850 [Candidatus Heimdallarchaeota archaeon LC_3]